MFAHGPRLTSTSLENVSLPVADGSGRFAAESVGDQFRGQAARESVLILEQGLFQAVGPVAGVDGELAVLGAPMADGVVVFEAEAKRIHAGVAAVARRDWRDAVRAAGAWWR